MNAFDREARDNQIVELVARGMSHARIAQTLGCAKSTVNEVMKDWRERTPSLRSQDPLHIIDQMLEGYQGDLEELSVVAQTTVIPSVRVGAINSRMAARDRIIGLLQATGVLPNDLGKMRVEIDVRYLATRVLAVFDKFNMPVEAKEELLALLEGERGSETFVN